MALATTGQVDWVGLSTRPLEMSLQVASRLANAGVDVVTVGVGRILGSLFAFPPDGQKELSTSLDKLKGSSSFSELVWFGFGIKHVVRYLAESEQGSVCVALCSALALSYSPFEVGSVFREMTIALETPPELTPSIHQWAKLVEVCQGSLARSHVPSVYSQFYRLLGRRDNPRGMTDHEAATVAKGMLILARLSTGKLQSATFVGAAECALLAAVAHSLLRLSIEIRDEDDMVLYRNHDGDVPQGVFRRPYAGEDPASLVAKTTTCFVSGGDLLIKRADHSFYPPTTWRTVFSDSFDCWGDFSKPREAKALVRLIELYLESFGVQHPDRNTDGAGNFFVGWEIATHMQWQHLHSRRAGSQQTARASKYMQRARDLFPELDALRDAASACPDVFDNTPACLNALRAACMRCANREGAPDLDCYLKIAKTVAHVTAVLVSVRLDREEVSPSLAAVWHIYTMVGNRMDSVVDGKFVDRTSVKMALFLLTGSPIRRDVEGPSAVTARGVCVYLPMLEDPLLDVADATVPVAIAGHISSGGRYYSRIEDGPVYSGPGDPCAILRGLPAPVIRLLVEETENSSILRAGYRLESSAPRGALSLSPRMVLYKMELLLLHANPSFHDPEQYPVICINDGRDARIRNGSGLLHDRAGEQVFCIHTWTGNPATGEARTLAYPVALPEWPFLLEACMARVAPKSFIARTCPCFHCVLRIMAGRQRRQVIPSMRGKVKIVAPDYTEHWLAYQCLGLEGEGGGEDVKEDGDKKEDGEGRGEDRDRDGDRDGDSDSVDRTFVFNVMDVPPAERIWVAEGNPAIDWNYIF